jgi:hypothetical protein
VLASDGIGALSAVLLGVPGFKDQIYRFRQARATSEGKGHKLLPLYRDIADAWAEKRDAYSGFDALCTAGGGLLLVVTFIMKMAGG